MALPASPVAALGSAELVASQAVRAASVGEDVAAFCGVGGEVVTELRIVLLAEHGRDLSEELLRPVANQAAVVEVDEQLPRPAAEGKCSTRGAEAARCPKKPVGRHARQ